MTITVTRGIALLVLSVATANACTRADARSSGTVRVILFGDSNTDAGFVGSGPLSKIVEASYVSPDVSRLPATAPHGPHQLAAKIENHSTSSLRIRVVNHGIGWTGTGTDTAHAPSARTRWHGVTRFEAEVLGAGAPDWDGGTGLPRRQAFRPTRRDFVYVSLGLNDGALYHLPPAATIANLTWMADQWIAAGLPPAHFLITTLPPSRGMAMRERNDGIRQLARAKGLSLIDLSDEISRDDGETWRAGRQIGTSPHYTEPTRDWLADRIADIIEHTP